MGFCKTIIATIEEIHVAFEILKALIPGLEAYSQEKSSPILRIINLPAMALLSK